MLAIFANFAARVFIDDSGGREFRAPALEVVPDGQGHPGSQPVRETGVFLVPLDRTPTATLEELANRFRRRYAAPTQVLARIRSERHTVSAERKQLDGAALINELAHAYPAPNARTVIIGVTHHDIFFSGAPDDRFTFGVRAATRNAVVSTARMNPVNYGLEPDAELLRQRLEKMTLRYLGELYFRLPRVSNDRSVLRDSIRSLSDIDEMTNAFCPSRPRALSGC